MVFTRPSKVGNKFTTIDYPGASYTLLLGINNSGQIVGTCQTVVDGSKNHGFIKDGNKFTIIDYPGDTYNSNPFDINNNNKVVGVYNEGSKTNGFLMVGNVFSTINYSTYSNAYAIGINDLGKIVGAYKDGSKTHGFLKDGNSFTTIDYPGASSTYLSDINSKGQILGVYNDRSVFLQQGNNYTNIEFPPGSSIEGIGNINNTGKFVGTLRIDGENHGYIADPSPKYIFPIKGLTSETVRVTAIMDHSVPTGYYKKDGVVEAFDGEIGNVNPKLYNGNPNIVGYQNKDNSSFLEGKLNYHDTTLWYDGHSDYNYGVKLAPVIATKEGKLYLAKSDPIDGNNGKGSPWDGFHTFYIDHGNGYSSWYLHCDHLVKEISDILLQGGLPNFDAYIDVYEGEEIAVSGDWGTEGAYHLHFEVRQGKQITEPEFSELNVFLSSNLHSEKYDWSNVIDPYELNLWASPVPVPSTLFMLFSGLLGLIGLGRFKKFS